MFLVKLFGLSGPARFPCFDGLGWSIPGFMHTWFCVTQLRQVALL